MKIFCSLFLILNISLATNMFYKSSTIWYGRVFEDNVYFYKTPLDNNENILFEIPKTYFVKLLSDYDYTFYFCEYLGIQGYVKKLNVQATSSSIENPYLTNIHFRVYLPHSQIMYNNPTSQSEYLEKVPLYTKNIEYIGKLEGETLILDRPNIWYYCKFVSTTTYYGYIYADGTDQLTNINLNNEQCVYSIPNFNADEKTVITVDDKNYKYLIILISLPAGIFVFLVFKNGISLKTNKKEKTKETLNFLGE